MTAPTFVPLCSVELGLAPPTVIEEGPVDTRMIAPIDTMRVSGERLSDTLDAPSTVGWLAFSGGVATIGVRTTIRADDGIAFIQYPGRRDAAAGTGAASPHVAVTFETSAERHHWLKPLLAPGRGELSELQIDWFEVR